MSNLTTRIADRVVGAISCPVPELQTRPTLHPLLLHLPVVELHLARAKFNKLVRGIFGKINPNKALTVCPV